MWPLKFTTTERNEKNLKKRGEIRPNSRCWHKPYKRGPQLLAPMAQEDPELLPAHVLDVASRDTGPTHVLSHTAHQGHAPNANRRPTGQWIVPPSLKEEGPSLPTVLLL
jgi:hypothetical protein